MINFITAVAYPDRLQLIHVYIDAPTKEGSITGVCYHALVHLIGTPRFLYMKYTHEWFFMCVRLWIISHGFVYSGYSGIYGTPTMQELKETIIHRLDEEWRCVGDSLGMSPKVMKEIGSKFGSVPTQCSEAMFSKWLDHEEGTGHKERTWGTILTALEDAGREDLTNSVLYKLTEKHKKGSKGSYVYTYFLTLLQF